MRLPRAYAVPTLLATSTVLALGLAGCGSSAVDQATDAHSAPASTGSPAAHAASGAAADTAVKAVVTGYPAGKRVRLPQATYPGAPAGLPDAMHAYLTASWTKSYQKEAGCEQVPLLTVWKVSSAGFARLSYNDDGHRAHAPACDGVGGGDEQIWGIVDGTWQVLVEGQDLPLCHTLHRYAVPDAIAGTKCVDASTNKAVPYHQA
jgi:hypothetical protein